MILNCAGHSTQSLSTRNLKGNFLAARYLARLWEPWHRLRIFHAHRRRGAWKIRKRCQGSGSRAKYVAAKRVYDDILETGRAGKGFPANTEIQRFEPEWWISFTSCTTDNLVYMLSLFSVDSRNCGPGERAKQGQFGLRPFCISIQLANLDLGPVQYQYELKLFKWTIQSTDYKWRKYRLETYKPLYFTTWL